MNTAVVEKEPEVKSLLPNCPRCDKSDWQHNVTLSTALSDVIGISSSRQSNEEFRCVGCQTKATARVEEKIRVSKVFKILKGE